MKNYKNNSFEENKEIQIFLKEIDILVNNAKEIENKYFLPFNKNQANNINQQENINYLYKDKKSLERQYRGLKYILSNLEKNYIFSPSNEKLKIGVDKEEKMTEEISNKIINLYITKKFNCCYNLWEKYDFKMLIGVSPERSFDMLKYLNKIKDRFEKRAHILKSLNSLNLSKIEYNNNQNYLFSNVNNNSNINISQLTSNSDIFNLKLNENEKITKKIRKQIDNIKKLQNLNN